MPETKLEPRTPRAEPAPQQPKSHGLALKDRRHLAESASVYSVFLSLI